MASSITSISQEQRNFAALCRIVVDLFGDCLWNIIGSLTDIKNLKPTLDLYINGSKNWGERNIPYIVKELCKSKTNINKTDCDISVMYSIIRGLPKSHSPSSPSNGWGKAPQVHDLSTWADIERIRDMRNSCYAHKSNATISDLEFQSKKQSAEDIVKRLDSFLRTSFQNDLLTIVNDWQTDQCLVQNYTKYIEKMKQLEEIEGRLTESENKHAAFEEETEKRLEAVEKGAAAKDLEQKKGV